MGAEPDPDPNPDPGREVDPDADPDLGRRYGVPTPPNSATASSTIRSRRAWWAPRQ